MAYLTYYCLRIESPTPAEHEHALTTLRESSENAQEALTADGSPWEWWAWYEHEDDMRQLSTRFPDMLFILSGKGEENEDIWVKYFKGGRMQVSYATIILDKFDERKLS